MEQVCERCDFCGKPAIGRCMVCGMCYCLEHMGGDGFCLDDFFGTGLFD